MRVVTGEERVPQSIVAVSVILATRSRHRSRITPPTRTRLPRLEAARVLREVESLVKATDSERIE
jgi:hypothetical protein